LSETVTFDAGLYHGPCALFAGPAPAVLGPEHTSITLSVQVLEDVFVVYLTRAGFSSIAIVRHVVIRCLLPRRIDIRDGVRVILDYCSQCRFLADVLLIQGDNSAAGLPGYDRDGLPRIFDGDCNGVAVVDMGVYELNRAWLADLNHNCRVKFGDYCVLASAWLSEPTDTAWNPVANLARPADSYIDWRDLIIIAENWLSGE
jgi:hypothetical protein